MADQEGTKDEEPMEVDEGSEAPTTTPPVEPSQAEWSDTGSPEQRQGLPLGTTRRVRPPQRTSLKPDEPSRLTSPRR